MHDSPHGLFMRAVVFPHEVGYGYSGTARDASHTVH